MNLDRNNFCLIVVRFAIFASLVEFGVSTSAAVSIGPDAFGYRATNDLLFNYSPVPSSAATVVTMVEGRPEDPTPDLEDDGISAAIPLGFTFNFYGQDYADIRITTNGFMIFGPAVPAYENVPLVTLDRPYPIIAPMWDDWDTGVNTSDHVLRQTQGSPGSRRFVVQWDVYGFGDADTTDVNFQTILYEGTNEIDFKYNDVIDDDLSMNFGGGATVGIANTHGGPSDENLQWSHNSAVIGQGRTIRFLPPTSSLPAPSQNDYSFKKIIDSTNAVYTDGTPSLNDSRTVAYEREGTSIVTVNGGSPVTIEDNTGPRDHFEGPSINNSGAVAYQATTDSGGAGIFRGVGNSITKIVDSNGDFTSSFGSRPDINADGTVAFHAGLDSGGVGIFKGDGGDPAGVAWTNGPSALFSSLNSLPSINDSGVVAFSGVHGTLGAGVFTGSGGAPTPIALTSSPIFASFGTAPMINNSGQVVFYATLEGDVEKGVFIGSSGATTTIADTSGPYSDFANYFIGDSGLVAFEALLDGGGKGIFTGDDPITDKVIRTGDLLFGSIVTGLDTFRGINANSEIAFRYTLANGLTGIALALAALPGDYNDNDVVDATDYDLWKSTFGSTADRRADGNRNGIVDTADYTVWRDNLGKSAGSGSVSLVIGVPEPASAFLIAAGFVLCGITKRRRC